MAGSRTESVDADAQARAHVRDVVARSGTSFLPAMRMLSAPRREAMYAIYAFCREVDDIADESAPVADKVAALDAWRREIDRLYAGAPEAPTARALARPVADFDLGKEDFIALIEGMEMDANGAMRGPRLAELERYCDRVACAVGRLSVRAFGAHGPRTEEVAFHLGQALQLTNILRDLVEDAERGRLYLPAELLDADGIRERDPKKVLADPRLPAVCAGLAEVAREHYRKAERALAEVPRRPMRPALIMMHVYRRVLERLVRRGWRRLDDPVALAKIEKLWIALRHGLV